MPADQPRPAEESAAGGPPGRADRARLAAEALAQARQDARDRGEPPPGHQRPGRPARSPRPDRGDHPAGERGRREDPQPLAAAIGGLLEGRGWQLQAAMGSVFGRWAEIVGTDLAAHTRPEAFADGELAVTADSTAWATQVRLLAPELIRRLNAELGAGTVRRVRLRGPAPPRQRGGWRVPGSKGPGDTYG